MKRPLFSCVMPVKGDRPYMAEALESLRRQGLGEELEIIVQDGDKEPDCCLSDAFNKGFAKAKGEWLFWLNADDVLLPGALKKVAATIEKRPEINWIAGNTVYINEQGSVLEVRQDAKWRPWFGKHLSVWTGGPSAFFRRELWERQGGMDLGLKYVMDLDLWTRWARAGERFLGIPDYLWGFRCHPGSLTGSGLNREGQLAERQLLLERYQLRHERFWRTVTRLASLLDGSWLKRKIDSRLAWHL